MFSKGFFLRVVKSRDCVVKNKHNFSCFLTFSQTSPGFYVYAIQVFWNTVGKGSKEQFLLFSQCFVPVWRTFCHFHQIWNFGLQALSVWEGLKFVVWERGKTVLIKTRLDRMCYVIFQTTLCYYYGQIYQKIASFDNWKFWFQFCTSLCIKACLHVHIRALQKKKW